MGAPEYASDVFLVFSGIGSELVDNATETDWSFSLIPALFCSVAPVLAAVVSTYYGVGDAAVDAVV